MLFSPYDVRLWQAQGMCYEEIGRFVIVMNILSFSELTVGLQPSRVRGML